MSIRRYMGLAVAGALLAAPALAQQPVGYATSPVGGLLHGLGTALGKVANEHTGIQVRVVPHGGGNQFLPLINRGELDVALNANAEVVFALKGEGWYQDKAMPNLRAVASTVRFNIGVFVRNDSPIKRVQDLKGQRMPVGYAQHKIAHHAYMAILATVGMSEADFKGVPVPHVGRGADDFAQGRTVGAPFAVGAGKVREVDAKVGGIRFLPVDDSAEAVAAMQKFLPGTYVETVQPSKRRTGIVGPTKLVAMDYALIAGMHVPDEVAYKFAKTLHERKDKLVSIIGAFRSHQPKKMAKDLGYAYHPGAIKFYQEQGMWPPKKM